MKPIERRGKPAKIKGRLPTCERCKKKCYKTYNMALRAVLQATGDGSPPLRIYRCSSGQYHLTKQQKNVRD